MTRHLDDLSQGVPDWEEKVCLCSMGQWLSFTATGEAYFYGARSPMQSHRSSLLVPARHSDEVGLVGESVLVAGQDLCHGS